MKIKEKIKAIQSLCVNGIYSSEEYHRWYLNKILEITLVSKNEDKIIEDFYEEVGGESSEDFYDDNFFDETFKN